MAWRESSCSSDMIFCIMSCEKKENRFMKVGDIECIYFYDCFSSADIASYALTLVFDIRCDYARLN